jgi:hypothetical protein
LITLTAYALNQEKLPNLSNRHTNWDDFRHLINEKLTSNAFLKTEEEAKAAFRFFNDRIQRASSNAPKHTEILKVYDCPIIIKEEIE